MKWILIKFIMKTKIKLITQKKKLSKYVIKKFKKLIQEKNYFWKTDYQNFEKCLILKDSCIAEDILKNMEMVCYEIIKNCRNIKNNIDQIESKEYKKKINNS